MVRIEFRFVMSYRPKHVVEYLALKATAAVVNGLPYRAALAVGWAGAWAAFHIFRFRVAEATSRIRSVFGDRFSEREARSIAWISWRNTVFNAVEMLRFPIMTLDWIRSVSDCDRAMQVLKDHSDTGKAAITAVPHMGNWELAGVTTHLYGLPIFNVAAKQRNPLVNRYIDRVREETGIESLTRGTATMRGVIRKLGEGGMLAILPDARMRTPDLSIPFLGGTANLGKGMALFARHTGAPIIPCIVTRQGWARHRIDACEPVWPDPRLDKHADIERMTRHVVGIIEAAIRKEPAQWFWFNKRWVLDPVDADTIHSTNAPSCRQ